MSDSAKEHSLDTLLASSSQTVDEAQTIRIRINEQIGEVAHHLSAVEFERLHRDITAYGAAVRAEHAQEIERMREQLRLSMLREANWNQMYHDQRERAERAESELAAVRAAPLASSTEQPD